jgi:hypothetical protein
MGDGPDGYVVLVLAAATSIPDAQRQQGDEPDGNGTESDGRPVQSV